MTFVAEKYSVGRSWHYLKQYDRRHIRWATIIIKVLRIKEADVLDPDRRRELLDLVAEIVADFRSDWTGQTRGRNLSGLTWRGAIELDLRSAVAARSHAEATLASLNVDTSPLAADERFLIVHAHLVLEGSGRAADDDLDGEHWTNHVRSVLKATWVGPWRVLVKGLRKDQSVPEAVWNLYNYTHKRLYRYTAAGGLGDERTKFGPYYERPWLRFIVDAYGVFNDELRSRR